MDIAIRDVGRDYLVGLTDYLRNEHRKPDGTPIQAYTVINYMACLRNALNMAVREDVLPENPMNRLTPQDKVKAPESKREFLTIEEVKRLEEAECKYLYVKQAFLFTFHRHNAFFIIPSAFHA